MGYEIGRLLEAQMMGVDFLPHWVVTSMLARRKPLLHKMIDINIFFNSLELDPRNI